MERLEDVVREQILRMTQAVVEEVTELIGRAKRARQDQISMHRMASGTGIASLESAR